MVKNKKGGSGHKKMARKNVRTTSYVNKKIRKPREEGEMIARVLRIHGGGHASILCTDKKERTLVIRGRFRGRNKRDNTIKQNSIVLVGLRSVTMGEVVHHSKKEKADLLEVYNNSQLDELKEIPEVYAILSDIKKDEITTDLGFEFTTGNEKISNDVDNEIITTKKTLFKENTDEEFNWDDI